nr:ABC transporter substrate-binding protein [Cohnella algarum]
MALPCRQGQAAGGVERGGKRSRGFLLGRHRPGNARFARRSGSRQLETGFAAEAPRERNSRKPRLLPAKRPFARCRSRTGSLARAAVPRSCLRASRAACPAGSVSFKGNEVFEKWIRYVDLVFKYSQKDKLTTDYATQVANFASGKAAMIQQGNWIQGDIDKVAQLNLGMMPIPIDDGGKERIYTGPANFWIVNGKSEHPEEAKAFLNWLVSSETGKTYLVRDFKFIPALVTIPATEADIGQLGAAVSQQAKEAGGWHWGRYPDGVIQGWGAAMQEYQGGRIDKDQLFDKLDQAVKEIVRK